ncbi:MAG: aldehyde dehydrogenase family protein, partial [Candidatus Celaenobacter polaris]|nr:aldehyde dehydrogenase family protein [Candidatus Celaenobacter polaris]
MKEILEKLGIKEVNHGAYCGEWLHTNGEEVTVYSPIDDSVLAKVKIATAKDYDIVAEKAHEAFKIWRDIPAPQRGEIIRLIGLELRKYKDELGRLVTMEMGKIYTEGL